MPVDAADLPNLTNLDKVFWPDEGYTKLDLLTYYQHVAPVLLPYVVDRPQALAGGRMDGRARNSISAPVAGSRLGFPRRRSW